MVPQGSPVEKEFAVAVGSTLVVVEIAVGLETFDVAWKLHRGLGRSMRLARLSGLVRR